MKPKPIRVTLKTDLTFVSLNRTLPATLQFDATLLARGSNWFKIQYLSARKTLFNFEASYKEV